MGVGHDREAQNHRVCEILNHIFKPMCTLNHAGHGWMTHLAKCSLLAAMPNHGLAGDQVNNCTPCVRLPSVRVASTKIAVMILKRPKSTLDHQVASGHNRHKWQFKCHRVSSYVLQFFARKRPPCLYWKTGCYYHSCCIEHVKLDTKSIAKDHGQWPATFTGTTEFWDIPARSVWEVQVWSGSGAVWFRRRCGWRTARKGGKFWKHRFGFWVIPYSSGGTAVLRRSPNWSLEKCKINVHWMPPAFQYTFSFRDTTFFLIFFAQYHNLVSQRSSNLSKPQWHVMASWTHSHVSSNPVKQTPLLPRMSSWQFVKLPGHNGALVLGRKCYSLLI